MLVILDDGEERLVVSGANFLCLLSIDRDYFPPIRQLYHPFEVPSGVFKEVSVCVFLTLEVLYYRDVNRSPCQ